MKTLLLATLILAGSSSIADDQACGEPGWQFKESKSILDTHVATGWFKDYEIGGMFSLAPVFEITARVVVFKAVNFEDNDVAGIHVFYESCQYQDFHDVVRSPGRGPQIAAPMTFVSGKKCEGTSTRKDAIEWLERYTFEDLKITDAAIRLEGDYYGFFVTGKNSDQSPLNPGMKRGGVVVFDNRTCAISNVILSDFP